MRRRSRTRSGAHAGFAEMLVAVTLACVLAGALLFNLTGSGGLEGAPPVRVEASALPVP